VQLLVSAGANLQATDEDGKTPAGYAFIRGEWARAAVVVPGMLIRRGWTEDRTQGVPSGLKRGKTALSILHECRYDRMLVLLGCASSMHM
jgi:hypothetical protein